MKKKIVAFIKLLMLTNLKAFNYYVGLSEFLYIYILYYIQTVNLLNKRKTELIKRVIVV